MDYLWLPLFSNHQKTKYFCNQINSRKTHLVNVSIYTLRKVLNRSNWRTVVINANSITHKKVEISAMADYCDSDLMLITETKLDSSILSSELLPKGYVGQFRRDRNLNSGGVMIVTKECYTITDLVLQTATQNETELVWATIT